MAASKDTPASPSLLLALLIVVLVGLAAGAGAGYWLKASFADEQFDPQADRSEEPGKTGPATSASEGHSSLAPVAREDFVAIEPVLVNLAGPQGRWIRLEASVGFEGGSKEDWNAVSKLIAEDFMGFLRGTPITQFETASGLEYLREDLTDLARIRTRGAARKLIIRTLVIE